MTRRVISRYGCAVYPRVQTRRRLCAVHAHATFFTAVENRAGSSIVRRSTESNFLIRENGLEMVHDRTHRVSRCCARILAALSLSLSLSIFFSRARAITWTLPPLILCQTFGQIDPNGASRSTQSPDTRIVSWRRRVFFFFFPRFPVAAGRFQFSFIGEHMWFFSSGSIKNRWDRCANCVSRMRERIKSHS